MDPAVTTTMLIPLLPFLAFAGIGLGLYRRPRAAAYLSLGAIGISLAMAAWTALQVFSLPPGQVWAGELRWLDMPGLQVAMGVRLDALSAVMLLVVTSVALLVQVYSLGYMDGDPGLASYFAYQSLFAGSMLGLVVASNFGQLFVFWELVGMCSYLLIGFWFGRPAARDAAIKAFVTNRIGDFGFLLGILLLAVAFGTLDYYELSVRIALNPDQAILLPVAVLLFFGPMGKSAQFPLHVWLPDAMEGPTPVSALIHAATMVAAGVYLIARAYFIFSQVPAAMSLIALVGGFTALMAASIALVQNDIKRILAYSTLSQLGYMVMAMGIGAMTAGMFHLMTHAFFKSLLFLAAGSVIHALHGEQDIWNMGQLRRRLPLTTWTFVVGALALSGIPPLSGFWSKDQILAAAWDGGHLGFYLLGSLGAFMTAFYMFRLVFVVFFGPEGPSQGVHESPRVMTGPLLVLAGLSVLSGFIGSPLLDNAFGRYVTVAGAAHHSLNLGVMAFSSALALGGIILAWLIYQRLAVPAAGLRRRFAPVYDLLWHKFYIDELYAWLISRVVDGLARLFYWFDITVINGAVNGLARLTGRSGQALRYTENGQVQTYGLYLLAGTLMILLSVLVAAAAAQG